MEHIVIIGGIAGGMSAASKLRRLREDVKITVFEKDEHISYGACGLPYYISGVTKSHKDLLARTVEDFEKRDIKVNTQHEVKKVNHEQKMVLVQNLRTGGTEEINYDKLLIATGSKPIVPPFVPKEAENVFTLKTLSDGMKMKEYFQERENVKRIAIIGGGYIGMELVETMKELQKEVTVIELQPHILPNYDQDMAEILENSLKERVNILTGEEVQKLHIENGRVTSVITDKGEYEADAVIVNIGNKPNTEFVQDIGLEMLDNGAIIVDKQQQTSIPSIYAAGDCATSNHLLLQKPVNIALGTTANKHGRVAADNLAGISSSFQGILGTNVVKVMEWTAAMTGLTEKSAKQKGLNFKTVKVETNSHASYYPNALPFHIKLVYEEKTKKLLGAQILGQDESAAKRIDIYATAITCGLTTEQIGMLDLSYAPPYATVWDAVQVAANAAK
ncbi:NADPH-dependent 2,4-dienoyl-CoA reductase/sulfur reductase-like enzyme [Bacillus tianshenii]|uniref:NADPH-dependent 2,4-dienoyl-CoA reductase/sulfur reductase-like enzyme n=1 Tax=Sutcliffiella tianshenii TaxID=1463404 RepID=A0ABS2P6B3_9BACI|nr:CoA-disulfide reductase [Bacillus tianshenii]MBM7622253.1 NADPH-dependent 2,4-dienoyl-CoA reductase/sulfur reductase-like enzyme [Bacillus tianshenii]